MPRRRPSASLPLLMQMQSSPASKVEFTISTFLHDSTSMASPFCAYDGFLAKIPSTIRFSHISGWMFQAGEFWKMTPCSSTFLQLSRCTITGRWFACSSDGCHIVARTNMPPCDVIFFHWPSVTFSFFSGRQQTPLPSMTPLPVMLTFCRFMPVIGD